MSDSSRVCDHCGAPLRGLVDGRCPYCRTVPFARDGSGAVDATGAPLLHSVLLLDAGRNKIGVIKELREIVLRDFQVELGLAEAKDLVDRANPGAPPAVIVDVDAGRALQWADAFVRAGATVDVRPPINSGATPPASVATSVGGATPPTVAGLGVFLTGVGRNKIGVIKAVRGITGLGLAEAKDLVDTAERAPQLVAAGLDEATARAHADDLARAGATAEVRTA